MNIDSGNVPYYRFAVRVSAGPKMYFKNARMESRYERFGLPDSVVYKEKWDRNDGKFTVRRGKIAQGPQLRSVPLGAGNFHPDADTQWSVEGFGSDTWTWTKVKGNDMTCGRNSRAEMICKVYAR